MSAGITIGRMGLDGLKIAEPSVRSSTGDTLSISGKIKNLASHDVAAARDQLRGLIASTDEPIIPFTSLDDPTLNGYYTADSVQFSATPDAKFGWFDYSLGLTRVPSGALPSIESGLDGFYRTNVVTYSSSAVEVWWAFPTSAVDIDIVYASSPSSSQATPLVQRGASDGSTLQILSLGRVQSDGYFTIPWTITADHYYDGACYAKWAYDGSNYRNLTCRQVPSATGNAWKIGNGIVEVTPGTSSTDSLLLRVFNGSSWSAWKPLQIQEEYHNNLAVQFFTSDNQPTSFTLTEVTQYHVKARVGFASTVFYNARVMVDLLIRRGAPFVEMKISDSAIGAGNASNSVDTAGLLFNEAATNVATDIYRATSNDGDGNRCMVAAAVASIPDGTPHVSLYANPGVVAYPCMAGFEIAGSGAVNGNKAVDIAKQYFAPPSERITFVGR